MSPYNSLTNKFYPYTDIDIMIRTNFSEIIRNLNLIRQKTVEKQMQTCANAQV